MGWNIAYLFLKPVFEHLVFLLAQVKVHIISNIYDPVPAVGNYHETETGS